MARAFSIVLFTAFYAALVLWALGLDAFADPALKTLAAAFLALCVASLFVGGSLSRGEREDRGNRWVLPVFAIVSLAIAIVPLLDDAQDFATFGGEGVRWLGVALFALGGALRLWPVAVLGHRFSGLVAIQPGHAPQTTGVYSFVRHPSYLGLLISSIGWALAFRSSLGLLAAACLIPPLLSRIRAEENLLASQFGAEYEANRART